MKNMKKITRTVIWPMILSVEILFTGCDFLPVTGDASAPIVEEYHINVVPDDESIVVNNDGNAADNGNYVPGVPPLTLNLESLLGGGQNSSYGNYGYYDDYYYDDYCYDDSCYGGYYDDYCYDDSCYGGYYDDYCYDGSCYGGYYDDYCYDDSCYGGYYDDYCYDDSCYGGYYDDYYYDDYCYDDSCYGGYYDDYYYDEYYEDDYYGNNDYYYYDPYYGTTFSGNSGHSEGKHSSKFDLFGPLGSASELEGTTAVVSVFADDDNGEWTAEDETLKSNCNKYLDTACKWISENAAEYGCEADFVYDFEENADLYYETSLEYDLTIDSDFSDYIVWDYIEKNIDSEAVMKNHDADNIIYMIFVDTPISNDITSCTRNYYEDMRYPYEMCYIYIHNCGYEEWPASYAHEMLHTFGAPDLYYSGDRYFNYAVPEALVNEYERKDSNNIMFTVYDLNNNYAPNYKKITNDFSEMIAYYIGITDKSDEREKWGMSESEHE